MVEFGTIPIVIKITPQQILKHFGAMLSANEPKVSAEKISVILCKIVPNFTEKDVNVLIIMYKTVVEGNSNFLTQAIKNGNWNQLTVDIRQFCIF